MFQQIPQSRERPAHVARRRLTVRAAVRQLASLALPVLRNDRQREQELVLDERREVELAGIAADRLVALRQLGRALFGEDEPGRRLDPPPHRTQAPLAVEGDIRLDREPHHRPGPFESELGPGLCPARRIRQAVAQSGESGDVEIPLDPRRAPCQTERIKRPIGGRRHGGGIIVTGLRGVKELAAQILVF